LPFFPPVRTKARPRCGKTGAGSLGIFFIKIREKVSLGNMQDAAEAYKLIILYKAKITLNFADKGLAEIHAKQLHLCGKFLLREIVLLAELPEFLGDDIGVRIKIRFVHQFYSNTIYFFDYIMEMAL
jgi:hypothetical protein